MKYFLLLFSFSILSFTKQSESTVIVNALKSGSADQVSNYFDKILDLKFPEKDEIKSIGKNQAGIALKTFYDENKIEGFELSSQREMSGTMYIVGKLLNGGEGFKLSMMLKLKEGKHQVITIRIN